MRESYRIIEIAHRRKIQQIFLTVYTNIEGVNPSGLVSFLFFLASTLTEAFRYFLRN